MPAPKIEEPASPLAPTNFSVQGGMVRIISERKDHPFLELFNSTYADVRLSRPVWPNEVLESSGQYHDELQKIIQRFLDKTDKPWTTTIGVLRSHFLCYFDLLESDRDYALIFEDDVDLFLVEKEEMLKMVTEFPRKLAKHDPNWGVLYFGWCRYGRVKTTVTAFDTVLRSIPGEQVLCLHAYAISRFGVSQELLLGRRVYAIDNDLWSLNEVSSISNYIVDPMIFTQPWQLDKHPNLGGIDAELVKKFREKEN